MLKEIRASDDGKKSVSSSMMETPFVVQENYVLTVDVKKMGLTTSGQHVTSKMLVIVTSNDQVYSIENALYTARRQRKEEAEAKAEREYE